MRNILLTLVAGSAILATSLLPSWGADLVPGPRVVDVDRRCPRVKVCGPQGCEWRRSCWHRCQGDREARYTCGTLYGAYGPWGAGYWDGYTAGY